MGMPPNDPSWIGIFHEIKRPQPFLDIPIYGNPHIPLCSHSNPIRPYETLSVFMKTGVLNDHSCLDMSCAWWLIPRRK